MINVHSSAESFNHTIVELDTLTTEISGTTQSKRWNYSSLLYIIYGLGVIVMTIKFMYSIVHILNLKKRGTIVPKKNHTVVLLTDIKTPFSFCSTMFVPLSLDLNTTNKVYLHELVHIKQRHSVDILFLELLKIIFWFNPLIYTYKKAIALNHEFLADQHCIENQDQAKDYLQLLLQQTYLEHYNILSSAFNYRLTKKRFIMITKKSNTRKKYATIVISCFTFLTFCTYAVQAKAEPKPQQENKVNTTQNYQFASYPGGFSTFNQDFIKEYKIPEGSKFEGKGLFIVQFMIETDGSISEINILKDVYNIGYPAIDVLKKMKKWVPAQQDGIPIRSQFTLPITVNNK
ncbi:M56 family metallopeptidase [Myroides pelagicus]|nr:M56 family metallopeptidase [Myroides pelagicus]MEC4112572.1 M56 family metallopeptidase [Myroides pelagicus]